MCYFVRSVYFLLVPLLIAAAEIDEKYNSLQRELPGTTICPLIFYECPSNSFKNPNRPCLTSFDDCLCDRGYRKNAQKQICEPVVCPDIFYECPDHSNRNPTSPCLISFDDCACKVGYVKNEDEEICEPVICPAIFYECPRYSYRKRTSPCLTSFHDCTCIPGYIKDTTNKLCKRVVSPNAPPVRTPVTTPIRTPVKSPIRAPARPPSASDGCNVRTGVGCRDGYTCTFNPDIACIALVGVECPGMCVPTCGGDPPPGIPPLPPCPRGTTCVNNPATPDCMMEVDCTGVCLPPFPSPVKAPVKAPVRLPVKAPVKAPVRPPVKAPVKAPVKVPAQAPVRRPITSNQCNVSTGDGCKDGFACTYNPDIFCIALAGVECPGMCVPACAGFTPPDDALPPCPRGTTCVDNPATPNCLIAADCTGVCLPPVASPVKAPVRLPVKAPVKVPVKVPVQAPVKVPVRAPVRPPSASNQCSVSTGLGCRDGYSCTFNPDIACIALVGVECPWMCVPACGGRTRPEDALPPCPRGTTCVDNPATPNCLIAADCTGVCLPSE